MSLLYGNHIRNFRLEHSDFVSRSTKDFLFVSDTNVGEHLFEICEITQAQEGLAELRVN